MGGSSMITAIISMSFVTGAKMWLIGWLVCTLIYFVVLLLKRSNRTKNGIKNILLTFLLAGFLVDLVWALIYYNKSGYVNHGIGAVYVLLLWPAALAISGFAASMLNRKAI
jgi:hypothetical protein